MNELEIQRARLLLEHALLSMKLHDIEEAIDNIDNELGVLNEV